MIHLLRKIYILSGLFLLCGFNSFELHALEFENDSPFHYLVIWDQTDAVEVSISKNADIKEITRLDIPQTVEYEGTTYKVTRIGYKGFSSTPKLEEVSIPSTVSTIRVGAFEYCFNLKTVNIANGVEEVQDRAFDSCISLEEITIPASVTSLYSTAFSKCNNLKNIIIDAFNPEYASTGEIICNKDKTVGLSYPSGRDDVVIPEGIKSITDEFLDWNAVKTLYLPATLESLPYYELSKIDYIRYNVDPESPYFSIKDNMLLNKEGTKLYVYQRTERELIIPDFITEIGDFVFSNDNRIESVTLPACIKKIGDGAFMNCSNLRTIYCYAETPPELNRYVFANDYGGIIRRTVFVPQEAVDLYKANSLWNSHTIYPFGYLLPGTEISSGSYIYTVISYEDRTVSVSKYTKEGLNAPKEISIPATVKYDKNTYNVVDVGPSFLEDNNWITSVKIPEPVETISGGAFFNCKKLKSVEFPHSLREIGALAFMGSGLEQQITIPAHIVSIGGGVFNNTKVYIEVDEDHPYYSAENGILYNKNKDMLISWPCAEGEIVIPGNVRSIYEKAFYNNDNLQKVTIPSSVERIGEYAFYSCDRLSEVYCYPAVPPFIGYDTFRRPYYVKLNIYIASDAYKRYVEDPYWKRINEFFAEFPIRPVNYIVINEGTEDVKTFAINSLERIEFALEGLDFVGNDEQTHIPFSEIATFTFDIDDSAGVETLPAANPSEGAISIDGDIIRISGLDKATADVRIFTVSGACALYMPACPDEIDISFLPAGIYLVKAGNISKKFIKR